jgi:ubiquinone biosynthesis protein
VVLKVRRPGIRDVVEADLRLLARLAEIVEARLPDLRRYRPAEVVQQFTVSLRRELICRRMPQCRAHRAQLQRP